MNASAALIQRIGAMLDVEIVPRWRMDGLPFARHLDRLFRRLEVQTVLDVGANRGQYRDFLRQQVGFTGPIVSFEPVSETFRELQELAEADANWFVMNIALGAADGEMPINVMVASEFASFLQPGGASRHRKDNVVTRREVVRIRRLDTVMPEIERNVPCRRVYLKLDTQGFDLQVMEGAANCLSRVRAAQAEMSVLPLYEGMPDFTESIRCFRNMGFDVTGLFPVCADDQMRLLEFDCVMANGAFLG